MTAHQARSALYPRTAGSVLEPPGPPSFPPGFIRWWSSGLTSFFPVSRTALHHSTPKHRPGIGFRARRHHHRTEAKLLQNLPLWKPPRPALAQRRRRVSGHVGHMYPFELHGAISPRSSPGLVRLPQRHVRPQRTQCLRTAASSARGLRSAYPWTRDLCEPEAGNVRWRHLRTFRIGSMSALAGTN